MTEDQYKPILLVSPGSVSREDIKRASDEGFLCIIECDDPGHVRFVEPPLKASLSAQAHAAMRLARAVINHKYDNVPRDSLVTMFVNALINNEPPKPAENAAPAKKA